MKTTSIIASVLFGSMAAAAPMLNKRAYVTKTSTVIQTEIAYTTVYADEIPKASSGAFFEQGPKTTAAPAAPTTKPAEPVAPVQPSPAAPALPSSEPGKKPPVAAPTKPAAAPTTTQAPVQQPSTAQPPVQQTSQAPPPPPAPKPSPPPASSAPAPKPSAPSAPSTGGGETHSGGSLTLHNFDGNLGSCGSAIANTDYKVALAVDTFGESSYDRMTGAATNQWCGKKINISYNGKSVPATIMDRCPGCTKGGLDVTSAIWKDLTGTDVGDRLQGMTWSPA